VGPVDARFREQPLNVAGNALSAAIASFKQWCARSLTGDLSVVAGPATALVYCQLKEDTTRVKRASGLTSSIFATPA
jgi:hypothetical protein